MENCKNCNSELKLDLYTRTYYCPNCKGSNTNLLDNYDMIFIYKELTDLNKDTVEKKVVNDLMTKYKDDYKININRSDVLAEMIVVFASKSNYLYSFRKYWSNYINRKIVLVLKDITIDQLPLELRKCEILDMNNCNLSDEIINIHHNLRKHLTSIEETSSRDTLDKLSIRSRITSGYKKEEVVIKNDSIIKNHSHDDLLLLLEQKEFEKVKNEVTNRLQISECYELYIIRLLATLKLTSMEGLKTYYETPLTSYKDFNRALELSEENFEVLDTINKETRKERIYQKAILINKKADPKIQEIELAIKNLKGIDPYKDTANIIIELENKLLNLKEYMKKLEIGSTLTEAYQNSNAKKNQAIVGLVAAIFFAFPLFILIFKLSAVFIMPFIIAIIFIINCASNLKK